MPVAGGLTAFQASDDHDIVLMSDIGDNGLLRSADEVLVRAVSPVKQRFPASSFAPHTITRQRSTEPTFFALRSTPPKPRSAVPAPPSPRAGFTPAAADQDSESDTPSPTSVEQYNRALRTMMGNVQCSMTSHQLHATHLIRHARPEVPVTLVLPTGSGKTIPYLAQHLLQAKPGITVVLVPMIKLLDDLYHRIKDHHRIPVDRWSTHMSVDDTVVLLSMDLCLNSEFLRWVKNNAHKIVSQIDSLELTTVAVYCRRGSHPTLRCRLPRPTLWAAAATSTHSSYSLGPGHCDSPTKDPSSDARLCRVRQIARSPRPYAS